LISLKILKVNILFVAQRITNEKNVVDSNLAIANKEIERLRSDKYKLETKTKEYGIFFDNFEIELTSLNKNSEK
jgi:hypothetical protein